MISLLTFVKALANLGTEDTVLVLADIVGGSPLTTACNVLSELGKLNTAVVLGGLNLTMVIYRISDRKIC